MKKRYVLLIKQIVFGSVVASRAAASALPMGAPVSDNADAWAKVRREMEAADFGRQSIDLETWLATDSQLLPLREAIEQSYGLVSSSEWFKLDSHWMSYISARGTSEDAEVFVEIRSALAASAQSNEPATREDYIEQWIDKVKCYDSGNCGIGVGGGGGNGTSNEGGGQGPTGGGTNSSGTKNGFGT